MYTNEPVAVAEAVGIIAGLGGAAVLYTYADVYLPHVNKFTDDFAKSLIDSKEKLAKKYNGGRHDAETMKEFKEGMLDVLENAENYAMNKGWFIGRRTRKALKGSVGMVKEYIERIDASERCAYNRIRFAPEKVTGDGGVALCPTFVL